MKHLPKIKEINKYFEDIKKCTGQEWTIYRARYNYELKIPIKIGDEIVFVDITACAFEMKQIMLKIMNEYPIERLKKYPMDLPSIGFINEKETTSI